MVGPTSDGVGSDAFAIVWEGIGAWLDLRYRMDMDKCIGYGASITFASLTLIGVTALAFPKCSLRLTPQPLRTNSAPPKCS